MKIKDAVNKKVVVRWGERGTPEGPVHKPRWTALRSLELATASPALVRLPADRFPARCSRQYRVDDVLAIDNSSHRSIPHGCFQARPLRVSQIRYCSVAVLDKRAVLSRGLRLALTRSGSAVSVIII